MFLLLPRYLNFMLPTVQIMSEYNIFFINNHIWLVSLFFVDLPPLSLLVIRISLSVFKTDVQDNRSWLWFLCLLELCFALDTWLVPSALVHVQMFKPQTPTLKQYARNWCRGGGISGHKLAALSPRAAPVLPSSRLQQQQSRLSHPHVDAAVGVAALVGVPLPRQVCENVDLMLAGLGLCGSTHLRTECLASQCL